MSSKYGKNGDAVAAFLDEVRGTDLAEWRAFLELAAPTDEFGAALDAAFDAPLSASARSAVSSAALKTMRSLDLGDLGRGVLRISSRVKAGAMGLAVRDALTPEQLGAIFAPFVAAGFRSVADVAAAPTEQ
jgi:hypothetical protein